MCQDLGDTSKSDNAEEPEVSEGEGSNADNNEALDEVRIKSMLGSSGDTDPGLEVELRSWKDLWEQLKEDIVNMHKKQARLATIYQLLLLHNFATLQIKGVRRRKLPDSGTMAKALTLHIMFPLSLAITKYRTLHGIG